MNSSTPSYTKAMFGKKKFIDYLGVYAIAPLLAQYLAQRIPGLQEELERLSPEDQVATLAATPQWTYFQIIDQYLVLQLGSKQYGVMLAQQEVLGVNLLPGRFIPGMLFVRKFFEFQLHMRQYDEATIAKIWDRASVLSPIKGNDPLSYLKQLIRLIQENELTDDNPNFKGTDEELEVIKEQLDDNEDLYDYYESVRQDVIAQLAK